MLKFIAHDTVNDVAIIQTSFGYSVRYGLQVDKARDLDDALRRFANCQKHALRCEGMYDLAS